MKKRIWSRLKNVRCPDCNIALKKRVSGGHACTLCNFFIGDKAFETIVTKLYNKEDERSFDDNLAELNNLGRKEIGDSFL